MAVVAAPRAWRIAGPVGIGGELMAKRAASRAVTSKRRTPRRWLPFLALSALVVVAAARGNDVGPGRTSASARSDASAAVATVNPARALSSAWFCGGGSAAGKSGRAEMAIVLANDQSTGARAEITVVDTLGGHGKASLDVPANGRVRVSASKIHVGTWAAATVEVQGGRVAVDREIRGRLGFDVAPCATTAGTRWYVPSGSTLRGAEEYLSIFNPFPDDASVNVELDTESGRRRPKALQGLPVPGRSLRVVRLADTVTDRARISATVRTRAGRVVVDRLQTYDGTGDEVGRDGDDAVATPAPVGLVTSPAMADPATRWLLPGASITAGGRSQVALFNPSGTDADIDVAIGYEQAAANPEVEPVQVTVPARSGMIVDLTDVVAIVADDPFTIDVRSVNGVGVLAEHLTFSGKPALSRGAGVAAGSPLAATRWLVTQGGPTQSRSSVVTVANAGPKTASVKVIELEKGTRRAVANARTRVPDGESRRLDLAESAPGTTLEIRSSTPVVVGYRFDGLDGLGVAIAPAEPFPETLVPLPPAN